MRRGVEFRINEISKKFRNILAYSLKICYSDCKERLMKMDDSAKKLKKAILAKFKSVRQFSIEMGIPYSTLVTALDRGIEGMAYGTVIRMCERLEINPVDFTPLDKNVPVSEQLLQNRVMQYYVRLNDTGKERILELMDDFAQIKKYHKK